MVLAFEDARASAHHLRERPVRHPLAVGKAAYTVPVEQLLESVHVLEELPADAALADAGDAGHLDEVGPPLVRAGVEQVFDEPQLAAAPDERGLQAIGTHQAPAAGRD